MPASKKKAAERLAQAKREMESNDSEYDDYKKQLSEVKARRRRLERILERGPEKLEKLKGLEFAVEAEMLHCKELRRMHSREVRALSAAAASQ